MKHKAVVSKFTTHTHPYCMLYDVVKPDFNSEWQCVVAKNYLKDAETAVFIEEGAECKSWLMRHLGIPGNNSVILGNVVIGVHSNCAVLPVKKIGNFPTVLAEKSSGIVLLHAKEHADLSYGLEIE